MTYFVRTISLSLLFTLLSLPMMAQIGLGGGLVYGNEVSKIGVTAKGKIVVSEMLAISPNFTYFLIKDGDLSTFNGDVHYLMNFGDNFGFYPFVGLNIAKGGGTEVGLNLGAGAEIMIQDNMAVFGEVKYILSDFDQLVLAIGVLYYLGDR